MVLLSVLVPLDWINKKFCQFSDQEGPQYLLFSHRRTTSARKEDQPPVRRSITQIKVNSAPRVAQRTTVEKLAVLFDRLRPQSLCSIKWSQFRKVLIKWTSSTPALKLYQVEFSPSWPGVHIGLRDLMVTVEALKELWWSICCRLNRSAGWYSSSAYAKQFIVI